MDTSENGFSKFIEWNNSVSLADILSLLMLIATFITILLVLIQRHDAAKPIVVIQSKSQSLEAKYGGMTTLPKETIQVGCFGNCLAKEVEIETCAVLSQQKKFFKTISFSDSRFAKVTNSKSSLFIATNVDKLHFDVLNNGDSIDLSNQVSHIIDVFSFAIFELVDENKDKLGANDYTQKLAFKISYKDILGKKYKTYIEVSTDIYLIEINKKIRFSLECRSIPWRRYHKLLKDKRRAL